jgi:COP9 signalosome complex subunit 7
MTVAMDPSTVPVVLQPFVILAKSATGAACADLIKQATSANGVYTFTALLDCENIRNVSPR